MLSVLDSSVYSYIIIKVQVKKKTNKTKWSKPHELHKMC